jgi:hypothetical protein
MVPVGANKWCHKTNVQRDRQNRAPDNLIAADIAASRCTCLIRDLGTILDHHGLPPWADANPCALCTQQLLDTPVTVESWRRSHLAAARMWLVIIRTQCCSGLRGRGPCTGAAVGGHSQRLRTCEPCFAPDILLRILGQVVPAAGARDVLLPAGQLLIHHLHLLQRLQVGGH